MNVAYACSLIPENFGAVASEMPGFDLEQLLVWLKEHDTGYFIRDEGDRSFDCMLMTDLVFHTIYAFEEADRGQIFRRIIKI